MCEKQTAVPDWLELELAHHLAATQAPDDLWQRVSNSNRTPGIRRPRRPVWLPIAAIVAVMVGAGAMWMFAKGQEPVLDLQPLAALVLYSHEPLELNSSDPREIRDWARREAGIGLSLTPASAAHLSGGRIIRYRGRRVAAVAYQVNGREATLLVAHAGNATTPPGRQSWQSGGQSYAVAFADSVQADSACLICHSSL